jgi:hypothetical protein
MRNDTTYQPSEYQTGSFASKAARNSFIVLVILFLSIYLGSERFGYYDIALYGYMWATVLFFVLLTMRITAWTLRPPTRRLWKQGLSLLFTAKGMKLFVRTLWSNIVSQRFIAKRSGWRWLQHMLISWGCLLSFGITFALVLGWMHFELVDQIHYDVVLFGIPAFRMPADSALAFALYHGLNWTGLMVIAGCIMALVRRIAEKKQLVEQGQEFDVFPLMLLLAISISGSLLTVSAMWAEGAFYLGISLAHQVTVIVFLLYFPFSKLWHAPMRFLAVFIPMYHSLGAQSCVRCGREYATQTQIRDVQTALKHRNLSVPIEGTKLHMSDMCSECRRVTHRLAAYGVNVGLEKSAVSIRNNGRNGLILASESAQGGQEHAARTE